MHSSVEDERTKIEGKSWPNNFNNSFSGKNTFKTAIQKSINTCAVKIILQVGSDYSIEQLKKFEGTKATEKHEYYDTIRPGQKKVLVIKEMIAHGAMLDTWIFPDQPSGVEGGKSLIDYGSMPVMLTPNEFRDGAIKAMN